MHQTTPVEGTVSGVFKRALNTTHAMLQQTIVHRVFGQVTKTTARHLSPLSGKVAKRVGPT